jgi:aquaporin Z
MKSAVSEFLGTYLLVATVGFNVLGGSGTWAALSIAAVLMVSIYSLASVSGANFNPAVTFTLLLDGKMTGANAAVYMLTQVVAGVCAGLTYLTVHGKAFNLQPGAGFSWMGAAAAEILYTFMLCFVVMRAAVSMKNPDNNEYFGMAIGFVIVAGGYAAGWISGGAFNPAVAIGIDVASAGQGVYYCLLYTVFELIGAFLAFAVNKVIESPEVSATLKNAVAEFVGTFFLVLTVGLNVTGGSPAPALSIGASLMCMIYALGNISGANFNPAVTLALVICGKMSAADIPVYMSSQVAGGLCAALTFMSLTGAAVPLAPGTGYSWGAAFFAEVVYTFVLCFVVLNVATLSPKQAMTAGGAATQVYGLAIGFCIVVGGFAIGSVSGGSLNPAVSIALDTTNALKGGSFMNCLAYSCFEFIGAGLAAGAFMVVRDEK